MKGRLQEMALALMQRAFAVEQALPKKLLGHVPAAALQKSAVLPDEHLMEMLRMAEERRYTIEALSRWVIFQRQRRPEIQPLDFDEKARLLKALPLRWRPYFEVAFGTGLRPSEQVGLIWERIDLKRHVIEVREGWRSGQPTTPPSAKRRSWRAPIGYQRLTESGEET